jgi:hypothetical protein
MQIGESSEAKIESTLLWNNTQITLVAGQEYKFHATDEWIDGNIPPFIYHCDADGYKSPWYNIVLKLAEGLRRIPQEPWFSLIGSIDKDKHSFFLIGKDKIFTAPKTGRLYCFANDVIGFYGNNQGSIQLTVTRKT